jgi:DNA-binding transcriptional LysR family regulator
MNPFSSAANPSMLLFQMRVRIFCVMFQKRSFTETGKALRISQSVVSRVIADLEEELKVALFDHSVRPIRPTLAGQSLYKMLLSEADRINDQLTELRLNNALLSPLRVGFVESIARTMSWSVLENIRKDYSCVTVLTGISSYLLHLLDQDRIDVAVCPDQFDNRNDLERFFVFQEPSIIILPKGTNLPQRLTWERLQFSGLPLVQYNDENSGGKLQQKLFVKLGVNFVSRVEVDINALLLDYVAHGAGWALTRPSTLLQHPDLARLVEVRPMPEPIASREMYVIAKKGRYSQLAARLASESGRFFKESVAQEMIKTAPWIQPYLFIAGEKPEDRVALSPDSGVSPASVFVL